ncbi:MAG: hypothetical protein HYW48_02835 [Deltaproteobacteria bacterium]|nr:hypothetical protein [Deltaproteobacteria bacterium]
MDCVTLKKKLSTYVSDGGRLRKVSEDVLFEVLAAWEEWQGTPKEFYKAIGFSYWQIAKILGKAKKIKREGHFGSESFKELKLEASSSLSSTVFNSQYIEVAWGENKIIRFPNVEQVLEFIKKASYQGLIFLKLLVI